MRNDNAVPHRGAPFTTTYGVTPGPVNSTQLMLAIRCKRTSSDTTSP